ncbi:ABC transporter ATP-binding protein [Puerhibacterium puerhi]|uniref:ABC transporter ATP-binding protein n=1 Tax=Puerhibacterium puerhi TaxID=2692623 RepID=UPI00135BC216|nr:ABC transporter ATP-binding protein [Puerhibacterium puerhi]
MESSRGIHAVGVRRAFGEVQALADVRLEARPGRVTALVGPNGSGKTTLLLVLAGLLVPDAGQVSVAGFDPVTEGPQARARTGWMPDVFGTWDSLTAREVLTTVAAAYRLPRDAGAARAAELLDLVHLTELADAPAHVLSRGQKQRLGLARALVHDPDVLLLDEPASGLDPRSRVDLRVLVRELAARGRTVLVSSHVLTELDEMADDAVFLSGGRTVATQSVTAAQEQRRRWRLAALDAAALRAWLAAAGVPAVAADDGAVHVDLAGDAAAAALLRDAVTAGVPVTSLAPAGGLLEQAYLALEEERR